MGNRSTDGERGFGWRRTRYERLTEAVRNYGLIPQSVIPAGSGFRIESSRGSRYLKRFRYGPQDLWFVYHCLEYLRCRGFAGAPRVYLTLAGQPYIEVDGEVFYLQDWLELTRPDFSDPGTLKTCAELMAALHAAGEGFVPPPELNEVRVQYGSWLDKCIKRLREIYGFAELAEEDTQGLKLDRRYAKAAPVFFRHAEDAVRRLAALPLAELAQREREAGAICHRNFTPRNIALDERAGLRLLDFDNCAREIRLDDVARFVRRAAYADPERAAFILQCYGEARGRELSSEELALVSAYLLFPREFWSVGRSRFHKNHRRERLLRRLIDNAEAWGRFAEAVGDLKSVVFATLAEPLTTETPSPPRLPADFTVPEGPHQPTVPLPVEDVRPAEPLLLWRADELRPEPQLEEVSEMDKAVWQVPATEGPGEPEPEVGVGTVPAAFPEGVEPFVGPAPSPAETAGLPPDAGPVGWEPVEAEPGEPERVGTDLPVPLEESVQVSEPVQLAEPLVAGPEPVSAEQEPAAGVPDESGLPGEAVEETGLGAAEYRSARASLATSSGTLVWGKWPKPVGPKDEGQA